MPPRPASIISKSAQIYLAREGNEEDSSSEEEDVILVTPKFKLKPKKKKSEDVSGKSAVAVGGPQKPFTTVTASINVNTLYSPLAKPIKKGKQPQRWSEIITISDDEDFIPIGKPAPAVLGERVLSAKAQGKQREVSSPTIVLEPFQTGQLYPTPLNARSPAPSFTSNHPSFSNPTMRQVIEEALEESSSDSDLDEVPSKAHPPSKFRSLTKAIETIVLSSDSEFEDDDEEEHNEADSMEVDEELPRPKISLTTPRRSFVGVVVPTPSKPTVSKSSSFSSRRLSPELTTHSSSPSKLSPSTSPLKRDRTSFEVLIPSGASSSAKRLKLERREAEENLAKLLDETSGAEGDLPERLLDNFLLSSASEKPISLLRIGLDDSLVLSGHVHPTNVIPGSGDDIEPVYFRLTNLRNFQAWRSWSLWVETDFAWYKLEAPDSSYTNTFQEAVRYIHLFSAARSLGLVDRAGLAKLGAALETWEPKGEQSALPEYHRLTGAPLGFKDVEKFKTNLLEDLAQLKKEDEGVLSSEKHPAFVTSRIYKIASPHFPPGAFDCINKPEALDSSFDPSFDGALRNHLQDLLKNHRNYKVTLCDKITKRCDRNQDHFNEARIGNKTYRVGDCVAVTPDDEVKNPSGLPWIGRIMWFFREKRVNGSDADDEGVHLWWFDYEKNTFVGRFSPLQTLVLADHCQPCDANRIIGAVSVQHLASGKSFEAWGTSVFFYRFHWDWDSFTYSDATLLETQKPTPLCNAKKIRSCPCCERREEEQLFNTPRWESILSNDLTFQYHDVTYHIGDDVFVFADQKRLLEVARIVAVGGVNRLASPSSRPTLNKNSTLTLQYYRRRCDVLSNPELDDRELIWTNSQEEVKFAYLQGHCLVQHRSKLIYNSGSIAPTSTSGSSLTEFRRRGGQFFVRDQLLSRNPHASVLEIVGHAADELTELTCADHERFGCRKCREMNTKRKEKEASLVGSIVAVDLFAGAGGSSEGFRQVGFKTAVSVESNFEAAKVYEANHPTTQVLQADVNAVSRGYDLHRQGLTKDPSLAPPQGVELVFGSPPCGPHSTANGKKKKWDPRETLALVFPAFVDVLDPNNFVLENVGEMIRATVHDDETEKGDFCRLLIYCFLSLGYQVQTGILCADGYGVPQQRRRLFILGTRCGRPLATLPMPSTISARAKPFIKLVDPNGHPIRSEVDQRQDQSAPHLPSTFNDITSDLPAFEYANPAEVLEPLPFDSERKIPSYRYDKLHEVNPSTYSLPPQTGYQELMRVGLLAPNSPLTSHRVARISKAKNVERICRVPLLGDHRDLPKELALELTKELKVQKRNWYRRINHHLPLQTLITTVNVCGNSHGPNLHSKQHRLITVREAARGQGFPDLYVFSPPNANFSVSTQYKLIGNAVPPPLAYAVGSGVMASIVINELDMQEEEEL